MFDSDEADTDDDRTKAVGNGVLSDKGKRRLDLDSEQSARVKLRRAESQRKTQEKRKAKDLGGLGLKSGQWSEVKLRELTDTLFLFYLLGTLFVLTGRRAVVSRRIPSLW